MKVSKEVWNLKEESFGPLLKYVLDDEITDINYNGADVWVEHLRRGIYKAPVQLSEEFVNQFSIRVSNVVSEQINKFNNGDRCASDFNYTSECDEYRVRAFYPEDSGSDETDGERDAERAVLLPRDTGFPDPLHEGKNEYGLLRTAGGWQDGTAEVPDTVYSQRGKGNDDRG